MRIFDDHERCVDASAEDLGASFAVGAAGPLEERGADSAGFAPATNFVTTTGVAAAASGTTASLAQRQV